MRAKVRDRDKQGTEKHDDRYWDHEPGESIGTDYHGSDYVKEDEECGTSPSYSSRKIANMSKMVESFIFRELHNQRLPD